ncbi:hypothetical protein ACLOJK_021842 [Asimina triloba]
MTTSSISLSFCYLPPFFSAQRSRSSKIPFPRLSSSPTGRDLSTRALRGWQEYEEAVKEKDLARALRFLKSVESLPLQSSTDVGDLSRLGLLERDWEVLDTCLNADDMRLVGSTYIYLHDRGFLPNFGKCKNIVLEGPRDVTPTVLKALTGLEGERPLTPKEKKNARSLGGKAAFVILSSVQMFHMVCFAASMLAPKKWGVSGSSRAVLVAFLGGVSFLISQGIDLRPNLAAILGLASLDAIFLGGTCLAQISCLWPPYRRRILVHEAGHLLTGAFSVPLEMVDLKIAGTQFWDEKLENELAEGRLSSASFDSPILTTLIQTALRSRFILIKTIDIVNAHAHVFRSMTDAQANDMPRYCMVLFAGIAAEALVYGEAEGGENDENLFRSISVLLQPPLSTAQMSNQARWSVSQAYNLLKWHRLAHRAAVKALESNSSLSVVIRRIEEAMPSKGQGKAASKCSGKESHLAFILQASAEKESKMGRKEEKSSKRRSPSVPSEDEYRSKKRHRTREDKEKRRKKKPKREEERKDREKSKKPHKNSSKHGEKARSADKHEEKQGKSKRKKDFEELSNDDYYLKNNEFSTWLKEEKGLFFSDLVSDEARKLFSDFVKDWNSQKLQSRYYGGITSAPRSAHNWIFNPDRPEMKRLPNIGMVLDASNGSIITEQIEITIPRTRRGVDYM